MKSMKLADPYDVASYLVAGRRLGSDIAKARFAETSISVDALADALGGPLVALPPGNFDALRSADRCGDGQFVVGLLAGQAGLDHLTVVERPDLLAAVDAARSLPWDGIAELFPGSRWYTDDVELHLMACGPLAGGCVGYGVPIELYPRDEDGDFDYDDDFDDPDWEFDVEKRFLDAKTGPVAVVPGLDIVAGNTMDQSRQPHAVYGVSLDNVGWEGEPVSIDLSDAAHRKRVVALGELAAESAYHLISHYD